MIAPILVERIPPEPKAPSRISPFANESAMTGARNEIAVLRVLADGPRRRHDLARATGIGLGGGFDRVLKRLRKACLIGREPGLQGAYYLRDAS